MTHLTVLDILLESSVKINEVFPGSSKYEAQWLFSSLEGSTQVAWTHLWNEIPVSLRSKFEALLEERLQGRPLQYALKSQEFLGMDMQVGEGVFIPRPETEDLIVQGFSKLFSRPRSILDLCGGSGALGIGSTLFSEVTRIEFVEANSQSLSWLQSNIKKYLGNIRVVKTHSMLIKKYLSMPSEPFDLIVCNPPYISFTEARTLASDVLREPGMALFSGASGYEVLLQLKGAFDSHLSPQGALLFEHHTSQQDALNSWIRQWSGVESVHRIFDRFSRPRGLLVRKQ